MKIKSEIKSEINRKRPDNSEVDELLCDNKFILENTNWSPSINLETGLDITIDWIKKNKHIFDSSNYHV